MGFFDKIVKDVVKSTSSVFDSNTKNNINNVVKLFNVNEQNTAFEIPSMYANFPTYSGNMCKKPVEVHKVNYDRLTLMYDGKPNNSYKQKLLASGFIQGSDVRYDRENSYIIIEQIDSKTKIAYHIKK